MGLLYPFSLKDISNSRLDYEEKEDSLKIEK